MTDTLTPDRTRIAADFRKAFDGKIPDSVIEATVADLDSQPLIAASSYAAVLRWTGTTGPGLECAIKDGETFRGSVMGVHGGPSTQSQVHTADIDALYAETTSFTLMMTPLYAVVHFFDDAGEPLGYFQGGGLTTVHGAGGGTGRWS